MHARPGWRALVFSAAVTTSPTAADLDWFRRRPEHAGVFADFDGTLSDIVKSPSEATPVSGASALMIELAAIYAKVGVISGRPIAFLQPFFGSDVVISGLYGLEVLDHGRRIDHPLGGAWREVIDDVAAVSRARGPAGMLVEPKGLSLTLHYRGRPRLEPKVRAWAEQWAARSGLQCRTARMSYELHPPIPADKGTALLQQAEDLESVCFIGDDDGDLPAYDALDKLKVEGVHTWRVAVHSDEEPTDLIERADLIVDGPAGVVDLLRALRPET
jgi:trehalose 6-phosphate phosphatase